MSNQVAVSDNLKKIFPNSNVISHDFASKVNVKLIDEDQLMALCLLTNASNIKLKRSGTGITVTAKAHGEGY